MKSAHERRDASGRYSRSTLCDACNKPAGTDPLCDAEVAAGTDGPGFILCERRRCPHNGPGFYDRSVAERRAFYSAVRASR